MIQLLVIEQTNTETDSGPMNGFKSDLIFNLCQYNVTGVSIMSVSPGHETAVSWHLKTYKKGISFLCNTVNGLESVVYCSTCRI